jgi:hypothetical protein
MKWIRTVIEKIAPSAFLKNSSTVRYVFSFVFVIAALLGTASVVSKNGSYVSLVVDSPIVAQDDVISIDVRVFAHTPINAVDIALRFPPEQVSVIEIDKGQSVLTLWTEEPAYKDGVVTLRGGTYKKGFIGEHSIATIQVKSKIAGEIEFLADSTRLLAGDGKGTEISSGKTPSVVVQVTDADTIATKNDPESSEKTLEAKAFVLVATDLDGDGDVSYKDVTMFMKHWVATDTVLDFNSDGKMSIHDFSILLFQYFKGS